MIVVIKGIEIACKTFPEDITRPLPNWRHRHYYQLGHKSPRRDLSRAPKIDNRNLDSTLADHKAFMAGYWNARVKEILAS